jgi:hypothetical protein
MHWFVGLEIRCDLPAGTLMVGQGAYVDTIVDRFRMNNATPLTIPANPHANLFVDVTDADVTAMKDKPYVRLIGSLMYTAIATRPDIMFIMSTLACFMAKPTVVHWEAAKRVLRYLKGTQNYVLTYGTDNTGLVCYSDSDWASQPHRHSITGWVFMYNGAAILWSSRKQSIITLLTVKAEFIASLSARRETVWLCCLLAELSTVSPTITYSDSQGAIALIKSGAITACTKHIHIPFLFTHELVASGDIVLEYCHTDNMVADMLTKALPHEKVEHFVRLMGLCRTA